MNYLFPGDRGTQVEYLQLALSRAGYPIQVDGIFGRQTCGALHSFLKTEGACVADRKAWQKLIPYLKGYVHHDIAAGDTIEKIAEIHKTTPTAILTANPLIDPQNLQAGATLEVPLGFPLVPEKVHYSSILVSYIVEGLVTRYPFLVSGSIGRSVMRKEIPYLRIGTGEKEVCYSASYHANESITTPVLLRFAEDYCDAYGAVLRGESTPDFPAAQLYQEFSLYLIPLVNPDGVDLVNGILRVGDFYRQAVRIAADFPSIPFPEGWKANIDGVDLNLQFPAGWEEARRIKYAQGYTKPAPRDYVGMAPLTAPESIAVYNFTREHNFSLIIAYHTQGEVIYWKYLNYEPERSAEIAQYFGRVSGYAVELTPSESAYAGYKDWFIQEYDRPGYTIEVGLGENPLPMSQFTDIYRANQPIMLGGMTQLM